jgi:D-3-phosphoglycerate dehydrogenase / 2-oxoglutarate reductase
MKIVITTYPFGLHDPRPTEKLKGFDVSFNDIGMKYDKETLCNILKKKQPDIIIAGTENYTPDVLDLVPNLKMISRVGIGLDGIDFGECKKRNILVTYTPDAPTNAVVELTILQILNMLRKIQQVHMSVSAYYKWNRYVGKELRDCIVGIIGCGRIGTGVIRVLNGFGVRKIFINDILPGKMFETVNVTPTTCKDIYATCDIISLHIPLKDQFVNNTDFVDYDNLICMKQDVRLLNMSRGGIINESALYMWLKDHKKACAAIDSFDTEPYEGKLRELGNAYLTPHLGSCTFTSRLDMELGAAEEVVRFINHIEPINKVI